MPSRHGSDHSLNSPPSLLYTMSDMEMTPSQHHPLTNLDRYDMYDAPPPSTSGFGVGVGDASGGIPVRPKRKQVKNACSACQRACKRCDVGRPCERCIKYGMAETCRDSQRKERKKGIKRGPYKKRDGMVNDHLQRMSPKRMSRVSSVPEVDLSAPGLIPIDVDPLPNQNQTQAVPLRIPSLPSVRPDSSQYSYDTSVIMPPSLTHTHTPPLSLAGIQHQQHQQYQPQQPHQNQHYNNSNTHPQASSSYPHSEDYYSARYDHPTHASTRPAQFRMDDTGSQSSHHQDYSRHVQQPIQDYTRSPMMHYPSPEQSPPRERQYSNTVYHDNSSHHSMVQSVHPDPSYQASSDSMAHDHETHDTRVIEPYYATHQQHQRSYSSDGHMHDVQQDHQQQQSYYSPYNAYQQPSTSYGSSHPQQQSYGYAQNHVSQQPITGQTEAGYSQHLSYPSAGSSMNPYPTQSHHQIDNTVVQLQYPSVRSPIKIARGSIDASAGMVAHPHHSHHSQHQHHPQHVGNVQIQSN
ncbi:Transcription activator of gluconeogenesis acuK [Aspergillus niger CBS 513,88] [Rhizoctonia solani]|uniref:Transcription activator of gluconeogenesis acuK [Aspergillus niger CBS 513,88] n=1 Tax=Rhizoctonia solani TaxID=456999 RepID=A0A0K6FPE2_9AGAM|nr:Transcription activator of gluconeogenesis acuK [Aspergillus niger CBS 513,88] [Rhizoctonia solani]